MKDQSVGIISFLMELSAKQTSITQLFSRQLLESIYTHLGLEKTVILCFDAENRFLSWTDRNEVREADSAHPYVSFANSDVVEHVVFHISQSEGLTYFNSVPKIYLSSDIIGPADYETSAYARFIEEQFGAHYSATLAFGISGYIQLVVFKSWSEGDFTQDEILELENLYVIISQAYINFKRHEQAQIISSMKDKVIHSSSREYFITDGFSHVLQASDGALHLLNEQFGLGLNAAPDPEEPQLWLPMILQDCLRREVPEEGESRRIGRCEFQIFQHSQCYDHGIVEKYFLITIRADNDSQQEAGGAGSCLAVLTSSEQKVARLLGEGMTYKEIAEELTVSYHTVKKHVENIYSKLGIRNRYQLYELLK